MMRRFRAGEIHVLVATTVIEVGIDVPNATIMVIEHPERFGLAQLHQLRGRIGRGADESFCILLSEGPAADRLQAFAATQDGFKIAELDLEERGMGDLIGARQSGGFEVRHARLPDDADLLRSGARARDGLDRRGPGAAARGEPAAAGAGGGAVSAGGGAVPGGMRPGPLERDLAARSRSPAAALRTSGSKGMLSGFGVCRVSSQTNIAAARDERRLATEQPGPGLPVVAAATPGTAPR